MRDYQRVAGYETPNQGLRIELNGIELTPAIQEACRHYANEIWEELKAIRFRNLPETLEEAANRKQALLGCFPALQLNSWEQIPNEYWGTRCYAAESPWFLVNTNRGRIKIGWRKHVIAIDYTDTNIKVSATNLFPNENVTRLEREIHADNYEKAKEYIAKLLGS